MNAEEIMEIIKDAYFKGVMSYENMQEVNNFISLQEEQIKRLKDNVKKAREARYNLGEGM